MKYNCKKLSVLFAAVMMFVLACPVTVLAAAGGWHTCCVRYFLVIDTASCGNRSGIDHKRGLQFLVSWNFSWSTSVLWR
jgi:hypothetical protein